MSKSNKTHTIRARVTHSLKQKIQSFSEHNSLNESTLIILSLTHFFQNPSLKFERPITELEKGVTNG